MTRPGGIAAFDVAYRKNFSQSACLVFKEWSDTCEQKLIIETLPTEAEKYISGEFYRRELPCLLNLIEKHNVNPEIILIDGYVWLGGPDVPGLGVHLYRALEDKIPVIGVAKTARRGDHYSIPVLRGQSRTPLFITSVGIEQREAADHIRSMHGTHRIPALLKRVDRATRRPV